MSDELVITDAVRYHSQTATTFSESYKHKANRQERLRVWRSYLDRYLDGATFAYDMGCGSGILAADIANRGIRTVAIDGSAEMLELAQLTACEEGCTNIEFRQLELPIRVTAGLERADVIISSSVVEYLDSVREALISFRDLLRPQGVVIFSIPNHDSFKRKGIRFVHRLSGRPGYMKFIRHFATVASLKRDLAAAGLTYVDHRYLEGSGPFDGVIRRFTSEQRSNNMILMVARRD